MLTAGSRGDVQPYVAVGVGFSFSIKRRPSVENFSPAIFAAFHPAVRERAADLGRLVRKENGVSQTVEFIH